MTDQVAWHENAGHEVAAHQIVRYFSSIVITCRATAGIAITFFGPAGATWIHG